MNPENEPRQTPLNQDDSFNSTQPSPPASPNTSWQQPAEPAPVMSQPVTTPAGSSSARKGLLITAGVIVLLALAGVAAAVALHHTSKPLAKVDQPSSAPASTQPAASSATKQTIPVNQTITDDVMGLTITVKSVDIGRVAIPAKYQDANPDKTVVSANVTVASQGKYALSLGDTLLGMIDTTGESTPSTTLSDNDLKALGLPVLSEQTSDTSVSGYVTYWIPTSNLSKLTIRYTRQAAGVIGSGQTIPRKTYDIVVRQ